MTLKEYTALAAALACTTPADAQISYSDLDPDLSYSFDTLYIDFDGDSISDIKLYSTGTLYVAKGTFAQGLGNWSVVASPDWNSIYSSFWADLILNGNYGREVNSSLNFLSGGFLKAKLNILPTQSNFVKGEYGFIGLRNQIGPDVQYGWLRVYRLPDPAWNILLLDYALNNTLNTPILAGDPGDTCLIPENPQSSVVGSIVTLTWQKVPRADSYEVIGKNIYGDSIRMKTIVGTELSGPGLPGNYVWKVRAICPEGNSLYTEDNTVDITAMRRMNPAENTLKIMPNPAFQSARLDVSGLEDFRKVEIYTVDGRKLSTQEVAGLSYVDLPIEHLPPGIYIIKAIGVNGAQTGILELE